MLAVGLESVRDLGSEFARRLQDERARHARTRAAGSQDVDHREGEAGSLAGAGLGAAEHVAPGQHVGYGLFLDRGRGRIASVGYRLKNLRREA